MKIILVGSNGKMGRAVTLLAKQKNIGVIELDKHTKQFKDYNQKEIKDIDVVLDFASPSVLKDELNFCIKNKIPLIICSTGHNSQELKLIKDFSKKIPIFKTANSCLGIAFINKLLKDNIKFLKEYDINIFEKHHKLKKDAPSGTAKTFENIFKEENKNVQVCSARGGSCVGEHYITCFANNEQIIIGHIAQSRELFADGALKICEFMKNKKENKLYNMEIFLQKDN